MSLEAEKTILSSNSLYGIQSIPGVTEAGHYCGFSHQLTNSFFLVQNMYIDAEHFPSCSNRNGFVVYNATIVTFCCSEPSYL